MSNENIYSAVTRTAQELKQFDEICGIAFVNLFTRSKNSETIDLAGFDPKNEEHLFLLGVAKGLGGAYNKKVRVDVSLWQLWKLNRGLDKDCRLERFDSSKGVAIETSTLLNFMRKDAVQATGNYGIFACIYREFYARKKGK